MNIQRATTLFIVNMNRIIQANGLYNTPITRCQDEKIIQFFENWKKDHQLTA